MRLTREELNSCPHSSSVMLFTLRVDTPCTYISSMAATSASRSVGNARTLPCEAVLPVLWHAQLDLAHSRNQPPAVIACSIPQPMFAALAFTCLQRFVHLGFEHPLHRLLDNRLSAGRRLPPSSASDPLPLSAPSRYPASGHLSTFPFFSR